MSAYWLPFRIEDDLTSDDRRQELYDEIAKLIPTNQDYWVEPTSFIAFKSSKSIDAIKSLIETIIDTDKDIVLLVRIGYKSYRLIGNYSDEDVFRMFPELL